METTITRQPDSIWNNKFPHFATTRNLCFVQDGLPNILISFTNVPKLNRNRLEFLWYTKDCWISEQNPSGIKTHSIKSDSIMLHRKYCHLKHKDTKQHHVFNYTKQVENCGLFRWKTNTHECNKTDFNVTFCYVRSWNALPRIAFEPRARMKAFFSNLFEYSTLISFNCMRFKFTSFARASTKRQSTFLCTLCNTAFAV